VIANDSHAIIPALDYAKEKGVPVVSVDIAGRRARRGDRPHGQRRHGRDRLPGRPEGRRRHRQGALLEGAFTSINGRDRRTASTTA
jgi:hypothetical protein